jgi:hypothetical protein
MKLFVCLFLIFFEAAFAGVTCKNASGDANGTWRTATSWDGTRRLTCDGATRPVHYIVANNGEADTAMVSLNKAIFADSWLGDRIEYTAGQTFDLSDAAGFATRIKRRPGVGTLMVTSTESANLPPHGTRITPVYRPLMPVLRMKHNAPLFVLAGAGPGPAEHIMFRGLYFEVHPATSPSLALNYGFLRIGGGNWNLYNSNLTPNGDISIINTAVRSAAAAGQNRVEIVDATYWTPGVKVFLGAFNGPEYTIETVENTIAGQHAITLTTPLRAPVAAGALVFFPLDDPLWQPDDITVQHCVFSNPRHQFQMERFIALNSRTTTIRDNWFSAPLSSVATKDTQVIAGTSLIGPYTIENNYIDGASENVMLGGGYSGVGNIMVGAAFKYNFFSHIPERDYVWYWCVTQESGCTDVSNANTGLVKASAGMSVPGLPIFSPRLIFPGRHIVPSSGSGRFVAKNVGVVGTTEPDWSLAPNVGNQVYSYDPQRSGNGSTMCNGSPQPGDGICWERTVGAPLIKNNFELKGGRNIVLQHNVFDWFGSLYGFNAQQYAMVNIKASGEGLGNRCFNGDPFPGCFRAETINIAFVNNIFRGYSGGLLLTGSSGNPAGGPPPSRNGGYTVRHNLFIQTERPNWERSELYRHIIVFENGADAVPGRPIPMDNIMIDNNTFYSPFIGHNRRGNRKLSPMVFGSGAQSGFGGKRSLAGNIWNRWTAGSASIQEGSVSPLHNADWGIPQLKLFPGVETGGSWGKNIILGASSSGFPSDTVWTGCTGSAACLTSDSQVPDWSSVLTNPAGGDFSLRNDHWGKRAMPDGSDVGADMSQIPEIRDLIATPSDRSVLFQWRVTDPIASIPCVVELHTAPDIESLVWQGTTAAYAGELSDIAKHLGTDADDAPHNVRHGSHRMLAVGYAVPLVPLTTYYYRLHCGGDVRRGAFTTTAPLGDARLSQTISRIPANPATVRFRLEYGDTYHRSSGSIEGSTFLESRCESDQPCSVSFGARPGAFVYYRWAELNEAGEVIDSSHDAEVIVAR